MDLSTILKLDKYQASEKGIVCARNNEHGKLTPVNVGEKLVCLAKGCDFAIKTPPEALNAPDEPKMDRSGFPTAGFMR